MTRLVRYIIIVAALAVISLCRAASPTQALDDDTRPSARRQAAHIWPLPSYTIAKQMLEAGKASEAAAYLKKEMEPPFPYGFEATNGYKIGFFYYSLLADALAADDNPVDALDEYRIALWQPTESVITNHPIPYAKTLYGLAKQFMKLTRWADAEDTLACALRLADNNRVKADRHWCRAKRAFMISDLPCMAREADACIENAPDSHWEAYHYAAWKEYTYGDKKYAMDLWLAGLNAFAGALDIKGVVNYLERALPYWKGMSDAQIAEYYSTLESLTLTARLREDTKDVVERLLRECAKLESVFPEIASNNDALHLAASAGAMPLPPPTLQQEWRLCTNVGLYFTAEMAEANGVEKLINEALWRETLGDADNAASMYLSILNDRSSLRNSRALINGHKPEYYVLARYIMLRGLDRKRNRDGMYTYCTNGVAILASAGKAQGGLEELYNILLVKGRLEMQSREDEKARDSYCWAVDISPNAAVPRIGELYCTAVLLPEDREPEGIKRAFDEIFALPMPRPNWRTWKAYAYWLPFLAQPTNNLTLDRAADQVSAVIFDALEICIFDLTDSIEYPDNLAHQRSINRLPFFSRLNDAVKRGNSLNARELRRLYRLFGRFGLVVPARHDRVFMLKQIIASRDLLRLILEREKSIEAIVQCPAPEGNNEDDVYLVCNVPGSPFKMRGKRGFLALFEFLGLLKDSHANAGGPKRKPVLTAEVVVPPETVVFEYRCVSGRDPGSLAPDKIRLKKQAVFDMGDGKMLVEDTVKSWVPATLLFECDTRLRKLDGPVFIVGDVAPLGNWRPNTVRLYDDGSHGDEKANDRIWSLALTFPPSIDAFRYMYTDNGTPDTWEGRERIQRLQRMRELADGSVPTQHVYDIYGEREF